MNQSEEYRYEVHFWPEEISFDVAGLFSNVSLLRRTDFCAYRKFGKHLPIKSVYGAPACKWNGGRASFLQATEAMIDQEFIMLAQQNWTPCLTFSNHLLQEEDVSDAIGNLLLSCADTIFKFYYVRVCSPFLAAYIRQEHPKARICASVILADIEHGKGSPAYYWNVAGKFERFVVHPDDNLNLQIRSILNPSQAEFLLNERCLWGCPNRMAHYDAIATIQQRGDTYEFMQSRVLEHCHATPIIKQCELPQRNCALSKRELADLIDSGFSHFKIQGRKDSPALFLYDLCNYLLPDEYMTSQLYAPLLVKLNDIINAGGNHFRKKHGS